jgi:hypothetical protein
MEQTHTDRYRPLLRVGTMMLTSGNPVSPRLASVDVEQSPGPGFITLSRHEDNGDWKNGA